MESSQFVIDQQSVGHLAKKNAEDIILKSSNIFAVFEFSLFP